MDVVIASFLLTFYTQEYLKVGNFVNKLGSLLRVEKKIKII